MSHKINHCWGLCKPPHLHRVIFYKTSCMTVLVASNENKFQIHKIEGKSFGMMQEWLREPRMGSEAKNIEPTCALHPFLQKSALFPLWISFCLIRQVITEASSSRFLGADLMSSLGWGVRAVTQR